MNLTDRNLVAVCAMLLFAVAGAARGADSSLAVRWDQRAGPDSHGYALSLKPAAKGASPFTLRVNLFDPPTTRPFLAGANFYGRPQREVALIVGSVMQFNRLSPVDLRATDRPVRCELIVTNAIGGADVTFTADGTKIYDRQFVPLLQVDPHSTPTFDGAGTASDVQFIASGTYQPPQVTHVTAIDAGLNDSTHRTIERQVNFPASVDSVGRVICTLTLAPTPKGLDPWDRLAHVYVVDDQGRAIELIRYITPYRKAWTWTSDVTDLLPLLHGPRTVRVECETYAQGWLVTIGFDFFDGSLAHRPFAVVPVWDKTVLIGQADHPTDEQLPPATIDVRGVALLKLRTLVTGHGMLPNTDNAGEFIPLWRKLWVNDQPHQNLLWKTDNWLNPCSPQHGTWKYDRAGWGPGTVVDPWTVDIVPAADIKTATLRLRYELQPYENKTPAPGFPAQQRVCVEAIECR